MQLGAQHTDIQAPLSLGSKHKERLGEEGQRSRGAEGQGQRGRRADLPPPAALPLMLVGQHCSRTGLTPNGHIPHLMQLVHRHILHRHTRRVVWLWPLRFAAGYYRRDKVWQKADTFCRD